MLAGCPEAGGGGGINSGKADFGGEDNEDAAQGTLDASGQGETGVGGIIPGADAGPGGAGGGSGGGSAAASAVPAATRTRSVRTAPSSPVPRRSAKGGVQTCEAGQWTACVGPAEACDGEDNDCDGEIDDGFEGLGEVCTNGLGTCAAIGTVVCSAAGDGVQCNAISDPPAAGETCDGQDNDCDGFTDEDAAGGPLTEALLRGRSVLRGVGACTEGVSRCVDGLFGACEGEGVPVDETCNGLDDDCDGQIDDAAEGGPLLELCYSGPGRHGQRQGLPHRQQASAAHGVAGPCVGEALPAFEICDGADNDCNGQPDDVAGGCGCAPGHRAGLLRGPRGHRGRGHLPRRHPDLRGRRLRLRRLRRHGAAPGRALRRRGQRLQRPRRRRHPRPRRRLRRGRGRLQPPGRAVLRRRRRPRSSAARGPGEPAAETCNGLDDDCDGVVDNGTGLGDPCVVGVGACRAAGVLVCARGGGVPCDAPVVVRPRTRSATASTTTATARPTMA